MNTVPHRGKKRKYENKNKKELRRAKKGNNRRKKNKNGNDTDLVTPCHHPSSDTFPRVPFKPQKYGYVTMVGHFFFFFKSAHSHRTQRSFSRNDDDSIPSRLDKRRTWMGPL